MIAGAKISALRNADMRLEVNGSQIVDPHALADPAVVPDGKVPGVLDGNSGLDHHATADPRAKCAQRGGPEAGGEGQRGAEQR